MVAIFIAMMIGWYLDQHYGKGPRIGTTGAILFCLGIAIFLGFLSDLGLSEVQITNKGIARAHYGHAIGAKLWRYDEILGFSFVSRENFGKPFALLILKLPAEIVILGVPDHVSDTQLIECFRFYGVRAAEVCSRDQVT